MGFISAPRVHAGSGRPQPEDRRQFAYLRRSRKTRRMGLRCRRKIATAAGDSPPPGILGPGKTRPGTGMSLAPLAQKEHHMTTAVLGDRDRRGDHVRASVTFDIAEETQ